MSDSKITKVMMDDTSINVSKEVDMVFSIANTLRGPYKSDKYKDVIIPMIIIRRLESALAKTKDKVVAAYKKNPKAPKQLLTKISGYQFYNTSDFDLANLLNEAPAIVENFNFYIDSFSPNVQDIINSLEFKKEIEKLDKNNRLLGVVKKFSELDLDPNTIDGHKMGYMFEEIIRKFSENAEAGDHYTPREVIRLLSSILLAEGNSDIFSEGKEITVLDMACGTGGMLSTTFDFIKRMNPDANVRLFGQENNPESYAICLADMLIKGQTSENIRFQDTMKADCFTDNAMRYVIANPPFGVAWGGKDAGDGVEKAVRDEYKKGFNGRFGAGLPGTGDMQLLFMQHAIAKMDSICGRAAIITNGSPLFSGGTSSGESQIRRYMLEKDLIEAIIALPTDLFYNTGIGIYAFILSKNKRSERKGKIQLINATDFWEPLDKTLGKKRREISKEQIKQITEIYANFKPSKYCKIFNNEEFIYKEYAVYQPLQRKGIISTESVSALKESTYFTANSSIFNEAEFEALCEMTPRHSEDEKKYNKYIKGRTFVSTVIKTLEANISDKEYLDYSKFISVLKKILSGIDGNTTSRLNKIAEELSVIDKSAMIQKDKKGNILPDPTTKDTEIIKLTEDVNAYFEREVLPYVPDAIWFFEEDLTAKNPIIKTGAEFPFMRYFYEYKDPGNSNVLLLQFIEIENSLSKKVTKLSESEVI